ncbi:MAG TPA: hypothetical protein VGA82_00095 [Dehalococcoidales bacterium]
MAEELGRIEKPEAGQFREKRRLYFVPLLYSWEDAPVEYAVKYGLYWEQVREHVANLESKMGTVNRIYHESVTVAGEEGLKILEKLNPASSQVVLEKCHGGAQFEMMEDRELVEENMDWERHLLIGFLAEKVANIVSQFFSETLRKRYEHIARRINETLKENESALLIIREGHMVQFPADIEVFMVAPPALDEIHRWLRDHRTENKDKA